MSAIWPSAVATDADLYIAKNSLQTTLSTALGTSDISVVLASATGFPTAGAVVIGNEVIFYTGVSGATLTGCTRGADGTTAATHSVGVPVGAAIVAFHHNGLVAEIEAIESYLNTVLGKGTAVTATEFTYVHGVTSAIQTQMDLKAPKADPTFTGHPLFPNGTVGAPGISFAGDTDTGIFYVGTNEFALAAGGVSILDIATSGITPSVPIQLTNGAIGTPSLTFNSDLDTGIYRAAANQLGIVLNGASSAQFLTTDIILYVGGTSRWDIDTTALNAVNSAVILNSDGTVSLPAYAFAADTDSGMYRIGANNVGIATGGVKTVEFGPTGSTNATTYTPMKINGGGWTTNFDVQATTGVSTGATTILAMSSDGGIFLVYGKQTAGGTTEFVDIVLCGSGSASVTVLGQNSVSGSPNTRTYSVSASNLRVAMGANTYTIRVTAMMII